jgi:hypothetical protein
MVREALTVSRDGHRLELVPVDRLVARLAWAVGIALAAIAALVWLP